MEPESLPRTLIVTERGHCCRQYNQRYCSNRNESSDELIILRALYLSQKRAEEAERKLLVANEENQKVTKLIIEVSTRLCAYKNWERLIEMDSTLLERRSRGRSRNEKRDEMAMLSWELGLVLLGLVGGGFLLGRNLR
ncbi:hypothetical protein FCM35_KLT08088 [Carex littledalei]|uniref:Uncharacterized protein n=1 Tax=Carex littledalei TaxID=544730 RepID=A0A833VK70_9POAL|nr:hypothetical protein FCM35_KLT08088 [Carex littledalei]